MNLQKVDLTNQNQKIFAGLLAVGSIVLLYYLLPPMITFFTNMWIALLLGGPLVLLTIFIVLNPMLIWNIYKQFSWALTKQLISGDKLGYMYRYHDYLLMKLDRLDKNVENITAMKIKVKRKIAEVQDRVEASKSQAKQYGDNPQYKLVVSSLATKINIDTKQLDVLLPRFVDIEKQEKYLRELYDSMSTQAEDLKYTLDAKADEYKLLKELSESAGNAKEFLSGNSEESKLYQESLVQIENDVTQYTANFESFERKVTPLLQQMSAEKSVNEQAGLKLIEDFKKQTETVSFKIEE